MGAPVVHFEIIGKNTDKLHKFYGDIFDWEIDANNPMNYGIVKPQKEGTIGGGVGPSPDGSGYASFYIEVDDPKAYLDKIEGMGGKTIVPTTTIPGMATFALFHDPEGNLVGLVKSEQ